MSAEIWVVALAGAFGVITGSLEAIRRAKRARQARVRPPSGDAVVTTRCPSLTHWTTAPWTRCQGLCDTRPMAEELTIHVEWEGDAPGLSEHRLSLSAFGPALRQMLVAYRRIAGSIIRDAAVRPKTRRLPRDAELLDIQISSVEHGCVKLSAVVPTPPLDQLAAPLLWSHVAESAATRFLEALDAEGRGTPHDAGVRSYLAKLPLGVSRQKYAVARGGRTIKTVEFGAAEIGSIRPLPGVFRIAGRVVGVGFAPGATEVRLKRSDDGRFFTYRATATQVQEALELRHRDVEAMVATAGAGPGRLLWIYASESVPVRRPADLVETVLDTWQEVLRGLAQ